MRYDYVFEAPKLRTSMFTKFGNHFKRLLKTSCQKSTCHLTCKLKTLDSTPNLPKPFTILQPLTIFVPIFTFKTPKPHPIISTPLPILNPPITQIPNPPYFPNPPPAHFFQPRPFPELTGLILARSRNLIPIEAPYLKKEFSAVVVIGMES